MEQSSDATSFVDVTVLIGEYAFVCRVDTSRLKIEYRMR